ncbi:MAG: hypothetical protein FRX49_07138 [Trebouxia sp. A1-2]|nr:MAG: hypothetical protein FRX49_07138 [Trebouxia sp. A1-2]
MDPDNQHNGVLTSMGADKLGGGYGGRVVLAYGHPKLLLLALGHQPGLMDPLGRYILQLWDPKNKQQHTCLLQLAHVCVDQGQPSLAILPPLEGLGVLTPPELLASDAVAVSKPGAELGAIVPTQHAISGLEVAGQQSHVLCNDDLAVHDGNGVAGRSMDRLVSRNCARI